MSVCQGSLGRIATTAMQLIQQIYRECININSTKKPDRQTGHVIFITMSALFTFNVKTKVRLIKFAGAAKNPANYKRLHRTNRKSFICYNHFKEETVGSFLKHLLNIVLVAANRFFFFSCSFYV